MLNLTFSGWFLTLSLWIRIPSSHPAHPTYFAEVFLSGFEPVVFWCQLLSAWEGQLCAPLNHSVLNDNTLVVWNQPYWGYLYNRNWNCQFFSLESHLLNSYHCTPWFKFEWLLAFPHGSLVKNPPANAGDTGLIPGLGRGHMLQSN